MVMYHDRNLIINYIPKNVSDEELSKLFASIGTVKTCRIIRDRSNGSSFGFGFCEYEDADSANKAIARFNGYRIADKVLKVSMAKLQGKLYQSSNLYVRNFPLFLTEEQLSEEFQRYGKVLQCRILRDRDTDVSKGSAYVLYDNRSDAEAAKEALNGTPWLGFPRHLLSIKFANPPYRQHFGDGTTGRSGLFRRHTITQIPAYTELPSTDQLANHLLALQTRGYDNYNSLCSVLGQPCVADGSYVQQDSNIHGNYVPTSVPIHTQGSLCNFIWPPECTNSDLQPLVSTPLQVAPAYVSPYYYMQNPLPNLCTSWQQNGSVLVNPAYAANLDGITSAVHGCPIFSGSSTASLPLSTDCGNVFGNDTTFPVTDCHKNKRIRQTKLDRIGCSSVYVYNIGNVMSEYQLWELFCIFGPISSVSIPKDPKTNFARNFGFITFHNMQSARLAINTMDGFNYGGRRLQVSFRKTKIGHPKDGRSATKLSDASAGLSPSCIDTTDGETSVEQVTNGFSDSSELPDPQNTIFSKMDELSLESSLKTVVNATEQTS